MGSFSDSPNALKGLILYLHVLHIPKYMQSLFLSISHKIHILASKLSLIKTLQGCQSHKIGPHIIMMIGTM